MSLLTIETPMSAINPKVWTEKGMLCARTALLWQLLTLFAWRKELRVFTEHSLIKIEKRYFWFFKSTKTIHFKQISHLKYGYSSLATSWDWFGNTHDNVESFSVGLVMTDRSEMDLFSFMGEGARNTGVVGMLMGDSMLDYQGNQQGKSLTFVEALREATGKTLSHPALTQQSSRTKYF